VIRVVYESTICCMSGSVTSGTSFVGEVGKNSEIVRAVAGILVACRET
jgi:hypothetical protein